MYQVKYLLIIILICVNFNLDFCNKVYGTISASRPYFLDENLEQAIIYETVEEIESNDAQFQMLDLLGLSDRPKRMKKYPSLRKSASKFLLDIYNIISDDDVVSIKHRHRIARDVGDNFITSIDETEIEKCNNIITFSSKIPKVQKLYKEEFKISFNINEVPREFQLARAELRLYQNSQRGKFYDSNEVFSISVLQRINKKSATDEFKSIATIETTSTFQGWLQLNLTQSLSKWLLRGKGHQRVVIKVNKIQAPLIEIPPEDIGVADVYGAEPLQPFMIGYFNGPEIITKIQQIRKKRDLASVKTKRRIDPKYMPPQHFKMPKTCQRMNFSMDFKDLQMNDWIIAPKKFEAYFCSGECNFPLGAKLNATNHAIVQTLMHLKQPNLPKPCCTPTALGAVSILHYLNEDSVNLSKYPQIIAKSCGCL